MRTEADFLGVRDHAFLVTGASSGIGKATAIRASRFGARLAIVGRNTASLEETLSQLDGDGHLIAELDLTDTQSIAGVLTSLSEQIGPLSGMFHSAGMHAVTPLRAVTRSQLDELFEINVSSGFLLAKAFRRPNVRADNSSIVLMSSSAGLVGEAGVSVYAATKAAVASMGRSLALELASEGVRVNSIAAGIIETPLTEKLRTRIGDDAWSEIKHAHPLGLGEASDVADAALYLLSPASRWVTGTTLVVDGGYTA